ncbi:WD repeat containing protein pop1 [Pleurostoma richardsiae]|uniref:WD repeat containing protein pop1 n=1 Tax=Pleurostoma richardsiae TaxID=41990 RepID=A0AA38RRN4_9PEZI|nr:WD repeat containing protein pop1 [Pleurostoma richardsiae]
MQLTETVTIINNSGKIISTGKHLVNIFKGAKASYQEKKAALKAERYGSAPRPGVFRRAQTFDVGPRYEEYDDDEYYDDGHGDHYAGQRELPYHPAHHHHRYIEDDAGRRRSVDDARSYASSRRSSHRSERSHSRHHSSRPSRPPLTESNLRTLSEVSATTPSVVPQAYRSPYAETMPRDMTLSRPTLHPPAAGTVATRRPPVPAPSETVTTTPVATPRQSMAVHRPRSDPSLRVRGKEIDPHLAYGNVPPDLASRVDLDPSGPAASDDGTKENEARGLLSRVEALLVEAQCLHHSAAAIISHLQADPEAAAAVALTLAELSTLLARMSPGFLAVVKGGWPAVFALLASPQFLVGVGVAVGVTVVCFGGWKIVKRIREAKAAAREDAEAKEAAAAQAFEMQPQLHHHVHQPLPGAPPSTPGTAPALDYAPSRGHGPAGGAGGFDEALVLDEELSAIDTWRRGIPPFGENESTVSAELITPDAVRSVMEDAASRRSGRTQRTAKTSRSKSEHRRHLHRSRRHYDDDDDGEPEVPVRKSSKAAFGGSNAAGGGRREGDEAGDARSERSGGSSRRSERSSKRSERIGVKAIEEGEKEKKGNMLKQLFKKKKDKDDKERSEVAVSVMV